MNKVQQKLILASSSVYRKELLGRICDDFDSISPEIDETPFPAEEPVQLVARLALQKAMAIQTNHPQAIIIGSDQVCVLDGHILGKPGNKLNAIEQLTRSSGKTAYFYTSLSVINRQTEPQESTVVTTKVVFRKLSHQQIVDYIERENPVDCAGSFKCEGLGISLFESIESKDPTALIGLPLIALTTELSRLA